MGPYLALPVLKSYLQEVEQYKVDIVDLNVEFYDDLLSYRHVEECSFAMLKVERYIKTIGLSKHLSTIQFPISMASPFLNTSCLS